MMQKDDNKKYVAFVCTGNTCRSPMAQAIFNSLADTERVEAESFGISTETGLPVSENSVLACRELGLDLDDPDERLRLELLLKAMEVRDTLMGNGPI